MNLNSERESHVLETLDRDPSRKIILKAPKEEFDILRLKNPNRLICAHLNINFVRNKIDLLSDIIKNNIGILIISETKLDSSFPNGQFQIHGYSESYRFDRNGNGRGIIVFTRKDKPTKLIDSQRKIEGFFIELNLRRKKVAVVLFL